MSGRIRLQYLSGIPITNGLGLSGQHDNRDWPRYIRTTDIAGPRSLRDDVFASQPPDVAEAAKLAPNDIIACAVGATVGKSMLFTSPEPACFAGFLVRIRPSDSVDARFLSYWMQSKDYWAQIEQGVVKSTIENFSASRFRAMSVPNPPLAEQRRIADFLDDRVSRIDRIIAARREQLGLVKVQFQSQLESLIWTSRETIRLKHLLVDVTSGPRGWGDLVTDHGTPFVRIGNLSPLGIEIREENMAQVAVPDGAEAARAALREGDVLLSITAAFGEAGVWREGSGTFSQHVARLRPISTADADWIAWVLQTASLHDQYRLQAYGGTKIGMGLENVRNLEVPARSVSDRQRTLPRVREAWSLFANGGRQLQLSIDLLTEYKSSLITAAVTGELDVSTAGSSIPG